MVKKIFLINPRGFCAGVVRAVQTVERALEVFGAPIYVKHQIVHNAHVVKALEDKGAIFIEDLEEVPSGAKLIFSAHGVAPAVREQAKEKNLYIIDATCPLVQRVHETAKLFAKKGYHILLIGKKNHVEVQATTAEAALETTIIESELDVDALSFLPSQKLIYLTQTTLSYDDIEKLVVAIKKKFPSLEEPRFSICYATLNRQRALKGILPLVDTVLVIGDEKSSNSKRLKEISLEKGKRAYLVSSEKDLKPDWFKKDSILAITAGASTPEAVVQGCLQRLKELYAPEIEDFIFNEETTEFGLPKEVLVT